VSVKLIQPDRPVLSDRLCERLAALGAAPATVSRSGRVVLDASAPPCARLMAAAPSFTATVKGHWSVLWEQPGRAVQIVPGFWVVGLHGTKRLRRRIGDEQGADTIPAAVLVGEDLLASDQFHLACDTAGVDYRATVAKVDRAPLIDAAQADRLAAALAWMKQDAEEMDRRLHELHDLTQQLGESYEELSLLYKLSSNMTVDQPTAVFLTNACQELVQVTSLTWMALQLTDDEPRLNEMGGQVFTVGNVPVDRGALKRVGQALTTLRPADDEPLIVEDAAALGIDGLEVVGRNLLVVWLVREGQPLGILYGADKTDGDRISSMDSKLCDSLANSLVIFLENTMLYEDMHSMFLGTLHALTASIDAKDSYTRGHSERVALLSKQLAEAAGLDSHTVERVYLSGLMHDVGKIGVPEAVLCKPGKLTDAEFELIKQHPVIGAVILQDIRQMQDLIPGVLHHHERWDGKGYPHKLAGEKIPLFGRLIALADSFDAMLSFRSYRKPKTHEQVLAEIERCAGTQFDPALARIFVKLDFGLFYEMFEDHVVQQARTGTES
jgi:HD-GYP domain-containing protein (c-di-GMP phosphodiesterase class II)